MPFANRKCLIVAAAVIGLSAGAWGQVLARPGWAGSGVAPEPWWRRAVLYRIDPARFQDSDGDGRGDLRGLVARLDYLQSLGVDGILLDAAEVGGSPDAPDFGEVMRESSRRGMRLLMALPAGDPHLAEDGRRWLNAGAAGIYLLRPLAEVQGSEAGAAASAASVRELRQVAASFPGERILASDPGAMEGAAESAGAEPVGPSQPVSPARPIHLGPRPIDLEHAQATAPVERRRRRHHSGRRGRAAEPSSSAPANLPAPRTVRSARGRVVDALRPQLVATARLLPPPAATGAQITVASLRSILAASSGGGAASSEEQTGAPLLRFSLTATEPPTDAQSAALWRTLATMTLASRGAAVIDFGAELGLDTGADTRPANASASPTLMQWTPRNRTLPPPLPTQTSETTAPSPAVYGTYHPYIPPPRGIVGAAPVLPKVVVGESSTQPAVDPDTLAGFTTGDLPSTPVDGATLNVAVEDTDPASLLNFYRHLIALHHDSATLRHGAVQLLDLSAAPEAAETLAWVRRSPAGSRTAQSVVIACNLGGQTVTLDLNPELTRLHLRPGALREMLSSSPTHLTGHTTQRLTLPPYSVFLGELAP